MILSRIARSLPRAVAEGHGRALRPDRELGLVRAAALAEVVQERLVAIAECREIALAPEAMRQFGVGILVRLEAALTEDRRGELDPPSTVVVGHGVDPVDVEQLVAIRRVTRERQ